MPGKYEKKISLRENVLVRLQEIKGCGSWSDAINSLLEVNEIQKEEILKLRRELNDNKDANIP